MKLTGIHIDGYGALGDLRLSDLPPGLVVLHGPNEAGKSTLTAFLRYMLFGAGRGEQPAALAGGHLGGHLYLTVDGESGTLERFGRQNAYLVLSGSGRLDADRATKKVVGDVDVEMYDAIWSFSLKDLHSFGDLGEEDLRDRLFSGALLGAGRSVSVAQASVQKKVEALWRPRTSSVVKDLDRERLDLTKRVQEAKTQANRLGQVQRERVAAEDTQREASRLADAADRERRRYEALVAALPHHLEYHRAEAALAQLPEGAAIPAPLLDKANTLAAEIAIAEGMLAERDRGRNNAAAALRLHAGANPWEAQAGAIHDLEVLANNLSADHVERAVRSRSDATGTLAEALSEASVRDRGSLSALRLGAAEIVQLARSANEAAIKTRAADALGGKVSVRDTATAHRDQLRDELASLPRDDKAAEARLDVDTLLRDEASVGRQRSRAKELASRARKTLDEIQRLDQTHAAGLVGSAVDSAAQARFAAAVRDWNRDLDAATLEVRAAEVEAAHAAGQLGLITGQSATAPRADAERACAALGAPWDVAAIERAKSDEVNAEALRGRVRRVRECAQASRIAAKGVEVAEGDLVRQGADPGAPGGDPAVLERRLELLETADHSLRRLQRAAGQAGGQGAPGWARPAALVLGVLVIGLGLAVLLGGVYVGDLGLILAGAALVLCGVLVALGGWLALAPSQTAQGGAGLGALRKQLGDALTRAELPQAATEADLVEARNRTQANLRAAGRFATLSRARAGLAEADQERAAALVAMATALTVAAWPTGVDPESVEPVLGQLRSLAAAKERREDLLKGARDATIVATRRQEQATAAMAKVRAAEPALRASANLLGVPAELMLLDAPEWLAAVAHRAELTARAEADTADAAHAIAEVGAWDARVESILRRLAEDGRASSLRAVHERCVRAGRGVDALAASERRLGLATDKLAEAEQAVALAQGARAAADQAVAGLRAALAAAGLDECTPAEGMDLRLQAISRARAAADALAVAQRAEEQARADATKFIRGVGALAVAASEAAPTGLGSALEFVARAARHEAAAAQGARERERAEHQLVGLEAACAEAATARDEHRSSLAALLNEVQVPDIEALRTLAERGRERAGLESERREARRVRDAALGVHQSFVAQLDTPDEVAWQRGAAEAEAEIARADSARQAAAQTQGAKESELNAIQRSNDIPSLSAELASTSAALRLAQRRLAVTLLASKLLDQTLQRFREAHQPAILRTAGGYVSAATGGVYTEVEPDLVGRDLQLVDRDGGRRSSAQLSTGTAELLYLVLRLGLAEDQASRAGHPDGGLPLVLDDVLVNLDPERAAEVARLLAVVAQRHQVLLLTCRPETRDLLRATVPGCSVVEMPRFGNRTGPVAGGAERPARAAPRPLPLPPAAGIREAEERLFSAIRDHPEGCGKSDLLEISGIEEAAWTVTITSLRNAGRVVPEGAKRGTVYKVTPR